MDTFTIDLAGVTITLRPGTTSDITIASMTRPGRTYPLAISTTTRGLVMARCTCPQARYKGACKHEATILDCISIQLHGTRLANGSRSLTLPITAADIDAAGLQLERLLDVA